MNINDDRLNKFTSCVFRYGPSTEYLVSTIYIVIRNDGYT